MRAGAGGDGEGGWGRTTAAAEALVCVRHSGVRLVVCAFNPTPLSHPTTPRRCSLVLSLLRSLAHLPEGAPEATDTLAQVGELMRQTHRGYGTIGLGCPEVDEMIHALTQDLGVAAGVFGARMSGGGSGGTVAILCRESALPAIEALAQRMTFGTPFPGLIR